MQSPTIIFDHIKGTISVVAAGPDADRKMAEMAAVQQGQVATSGQPQKS